MVKLNIQRFGLHGSIGLERRVNTASLLLGSILRGKARLLKSIDFVSEVFLLILLTYMLDFFFTLD